MTDNERLARIDRKIDDLLDSFQKHALESVEIRVHVGILKKLVYGAVGIGMTAICVAICALVIKS